MTTDTSENANAGEMDSPSDSTPVRKRKSVLGTILLALAVAIGVFLIVVAMHPAEFTIARSTTVSAPPDAVFAEVNDFHKWEAWSPWAKLDPTMKQTFEGPVTGMGSRYSWVGNSEVGEGRMIIVESLPHDRIEIQLDFLKPFAATHTAIFTFKPEGQKTVLTWRMTGKNNFIGKVFALLMNMDKMVGGQFEQGLSKIKSITEAEARKP